MSNQQTNETTHEVTPQQTVLVKEDENYTIHKDSSGKYSRRAKYALYSSFEAQTREEKVWLLNLFDSQEGSATALSDAVGSTINIKHVIIRKYDSIDEDSGELVNGVLTYLIDTDDNAYVTSAKAVYFSINRIMEVFGKPTDDEWVDMKVTVTKTKMTNGDAINIKML